VSWQVDHLVVGAATLEQGAAWCAETLGVLPGPGGKHPLMGTHNSLLAIGSAAFPRCYLEIIAIDPQAKVPARKRWFDLDEAALRATLAAGPRLIHWAARCDDVAADCTVLAAAGIDRGEVLDAERDTPRGLLRWRIAVRRDGARLAGGALPTLIEWGDVHPADSLPVSPLQLESLSVGGLPEVVTNRLPGSVSTREAFAATLATPLGRARLEGAA
jgi:hypothetical protein